MTPDFEQKVRKLAPCPFCGLDAGHYQPTPSQHFIACQVCDCRTASFPTKAAALATWNTRAPAQALREMYEEEGAANSGAPAGDAVLYRHKKRGTVYELICEAQAQVSHEWPISDYALLQVHRDIETGGFWARHAGEFHDGRFEKLNPTQGA